MPYINRFIQPDTVIPDLSKPQSWNRYSYVGNNPIRYTDPAGHREVDGCSELAGGCNVTQKMKDDDAQKLAVLEKESGQRQWDSLVSANVDAELLVRAEKGISVDLDDNGDPVYIPGAGYMYTTENSLQFSGNEVPNILDVNVEWGTSDTDVLRVIPLW